MNTLRDIIEAAKIETGLGLGNLTALSPQNDPYRLDTPANHLVGQWFAEQMERLNLLHRRLHLRGIHYALLGSTAMPSGEPYINTGECWDWLQTEASKAARWLGYVPFDSITDARNTAPVIRILERTTPEPMLSVMPDIIMPSVDDLEPTIYLKGFEGEQPYRLAFYGEKTSLEPVLSPMADIYKADLFLPTGEISDTQMYAMARAGADDGRRLIVFVLADFDPAGNQMAVSIGRKLQALRDLHFPALRFSLYPIALTADQVREFDLPSTPLKATEKRADRWREEHDGLEQTEVDALATLRPELLREIVHKAVATFYDRTLSSRVFEAKGEWLDAARTALDEQMNSETMLTIRARAELQIDHIRAQIKEIETATAMATEGLDLYLPVPEVPEAVIDENLQPLPLIASDWTWADQTAALVARKRYGNGSAP
jgi:hypothetical protein